MQFGRAEYTEIWAPGAVVPLLGWADRARSLPGTGLDLLGVGDLPANPRLVERLREFDSIVSWYGANREDFRHATEALKLPFEFFPALPPPSADGHAANGHAANGHAIDFFAAQLGAPRGLVPKLAAGRAPVRDSIVIHPFSGSAKKNWPLEKFQELARASGVRVEWIAGPEETLPEAVRFDNLWEAARWMAGARLYIGNDSGMTHLAAAAGVPVIALFGPTDPAVWGPRGENVVIRRWEPIRDLPVSETLQEVRRALARV